MTIRLTSWHSEDFDIYTEVVDPRNSCYAWMRGYVEKVEAFYRELGSRRRFGRFRMVPYRRCLSSANQLNTFWR